MALSELMDRGVESGVFPGGVLLVEQAGRLLHCSAHGRTRLDCDGEPTAVDTLFDLASLTKVLATTSVALLAAAEGALDLEAPIAGALYRPADLLLHTSGLPAWRPYYAELAGAEPRPSRAARDWVRSRVRAEPLEAAPGGLELYSDLGFIRLDELLHTILGETLDRLFDVRVAGPLGQSDLFFIDLTDPARANEMRRGRTFAATERCPWRGRMLVGEVHDDNTWAMGGVSGHAGLFGSAPAVARLARAWLDGFAGRPSLFPTAWVRRFFARGAGTRTLGFDTPAPERSQAGSRMGPRTVGHLGFTGTSLWIDPDRELIAVLLTNRVHPSRSNESILSFRPRLHESIVDAIDVWSTTF